MYRYDRDPNFHKQAASLVGHTIREASIHEEGGSAWLRLHLDDGRIVDVGVTGSLHDEAYFVLVAGYSTNPPSAKDFPQEREQDPHTMQVETEEG